MGNFFTKGKWMPQDKIGFYFYFSVIFFTFSFLIFSAGFFINTSGKEELIKSQESARIFYRQLEFQLREKAGSVVASNSIDPLVYKTILRVAGNLPYSEVTEYRCNKDIIEMKTSKAEGDIEFIKRQIPYAEVVQNIDNNYVIQLFL